MNLEEYKGVYVFAQQVDNIVNSIAFELIGKGKDLAADLGTEVTAVLVGSGVKGLADELAEYGADRVIVVDDPELKEYRTEPYAHALASVIEKYKPEIFLVGATAIGRDLGPRVSARIHTGLTADCTQLDIGDFPLNPIPGKEQKHNQLLMTRPAFGGNTIATIACPDFRPQMATVRPGVMQKKERQAGAKANIEEFNPGFTPNQNYVEILEVVKAVSETVDIMDAKILVSGGRGMGSAENFKILEDLRHRELLPCRGGRRLEAQGSPGRSDRQDRPPQCVLRHRHLRRHPTSGRHGGVRHHHRHQQGRNGSYL
jgi:electron transfer flavoprotein alpha subunit